MGLLAGPILLVHICKTCGYACAGLISLMIDPIRIDMDMKITKKFFNRG